MASKNPSTDVSAASGASNPDNSEKDKLSLGGAQTEGSAAKAEAKYKRRELYRDLGITFPVSRVKQVLNGDNVNSGIASELEKNKEDADKNATLKTYKVRFSEGAAVAATVLAEKMIESLVINAFAAANKAKRHTVTLHNLYGEGIEDNPFYHVLIRLPAALAAIDEVNTKIGADNRAAVMKEFYKRHRIPLAKRDLPAEAEAEENGEAEEAGAAEAADESSGAEDAADKESAGNAPDAQKSGAAAKPKKQFEHYIAKYFAVLRKQGHEKMQGSEKIRTHLSALVREFLGLLARCSEELLQTTHNKTISDKIITTVAKILIVPPTPNLYRYSYEGNKVDRELIPGDSDGELIVQHVSKLSDEYLSSIAASRPAKPATAEKADGAAPAKA